MFEQSSGGNRQSYLGNAKVVEGIVRGFVGRVAHAKSAQEIETACVQCAEIFAGLDDRFTPIDGWDTRHGLGQVFAERLGCDFSQSTTEILKTGFGVMSRYVLNIIKEHGEGPDDVWQHKIDTLVDYAVAILMGTIDTVYPKGSPL